MKVLSRLFDQNERDVGRLRRMVDVINSLEPGYKSMSDAELQSLTAEFRQRLANGQKMEDILPHAYALVRETGWRLLGQRAFDVQVMGGIVLHEGRIAEMKTGEGKTLASTMPAYLNALGGKGVHVVTVNDYLAKRDSEWMGQIYRFLGLKVGLIVNGLDASTRKPSYLSDITYGTNNEFGFDYLRDNMVVAADEKVQRELNYAIVDEVDSILIDEARTPLIISGAVEAPTDIYYRCARLVQTLHEGQDYTIDEKAHTVSTPKEGEPACDAVYRKVEKALGIDMKTQAAEYWNYVEQALKAKELMKRDREYVIRDGQVIIVDEFTGRLMLGRRYSDGLHEAIEAKEGLRIEQQSQTLATITLQNYFRMYKKLAGMTGTAQTEEEELTKIYGTDVVVLPTNLPMIRKDFPDVVYKTEQGKFRAVINEIIEKHSTGQPLLVGTISIEKSEVLSAMLHRKGIEHQVLNAKYHEKEAEIVAQAGREETVTIATNMAGRGTDIMLGGNPGFMAREQMKREEFPDWVIAEASEQVPTTHPEVARARERYKQLYDQYKKQTDEEHDRVVRLGGLHIIGTERHEARRIDNQLRGRSGRQGDPGSSRFYIALEDDLMRLFGADMVAGFMDKLGFSEDEPIEHPLLSRAIENAQKRVEARNFSIRKSVLEYDDVMNKQRETIYSQRNRVLHGGDLRESIREMISNVVEHVVSTYAPPSVHRDDWDLQGLVSYAEAEFFPPGFVRAESLAGGDRNEVASRLREAADQAYEQRETQIGPGILREIERVVLLRVVDIKWMEHLRNMDVLREGISLRAYGQRDPLIEYTREAFDMFDAMIDSIQHDTVRYLYRVQLAPEVKRPAAKPIATGPRQPQTGKRKIGRNDPCPCGSGKKYKHCCGRNL